MPPKVIKQGTKRYTPELDDTLTDSQSSVAGFRPHDDSGTTTNKSFRFPSNKTLEGYSSGYHESAVTTDNYEYLKKAKDNNDGTSTLATSDKKSFFSKYDNKVVDTKTLKIVLELADQYRTDTAQTILSGPKGTVAGHSGSNIDTTGQSDAHNILRETVMKILIEGPSLKGATKEAIEVTFGAITVTSIAPGELARTVKGGTSSIKAQQVKPKWELKRNEAKNRVVKSYNGLSQLEKDFVDHFAPSYLDLINDMVDDPLKRKYDSNYPVTPLRDPFYTDSPNGVLGGRYTKSKFTTPRVEPPSSGKNMGLYATQEFRGKRRKLFENNE